MTTVAALRALIDKAEATLDFDPDNCTGREADARAAFVRGCPPALVAALARVAQAAQVLAYAGSNIHTIAALGVALRDLDRVIKETTL